MQKIDPLAVDLLRKTITLPHLGLTTRTILAAASDSAWTWIESLAEQDRKKYYNWRPRFKMMYKQVCIGEIYLKSYGQYHQGADD